MINVTEIILNFQNFLVATAKSLSVIGLFKGSDEWEELTEVAFDILVINCLSEKFGCKISHQYEAWNFNKNGIVVQVKEGASILVGLKSESSECEHRYDEIKKIARAYNFYFVEFGNPSISEENTRGLEYVEGFDDNGRAICAKKQDCEFFVEDLYDKESKN